MVATRPVDIPKGAEDLAALVKAEMGAVPFSGAGLEALSCAGRGAGSGEGGIAAATN